MVKYILPSSYEMIVITMNLGTLTDVILAKLRKVSCEKESHTMILLDSAYESFFDIVLYSKKMHCTVLLKTPESRMMYERVTVPCITPKCIPKGPCSLNIPFCKSRNECLYNAFINMSYAPTYATISETT